MGGSCQSKTQQRSGMLHSIIDEYRENGISFQPADNTVLSGLNRVNEYFKSDRLFIFKTCVNTVREIENYKWRAVKSDGVVHEEPVKKNDHCCDALRYLIMSRYEKTDKIEVDPLSLPHAEDTAWGKAQLLRKKASTYVR